jgi:branched-chain amino acid transport system substrate-binding protein
VGLESVDCKVLAEASALEKDDTIWLGALLPATGPDADDFGRVETHAVDLARRDFDQVMSGIADQRTGDGARRFGVLACDDAVDPSRAASHLIDDVGVPAIIGFKSGVELMDLTTRILLPKQVLAVATLSTNPLVTRIPQGDPRLIWRTTYDASASASAIAAYVRDVVSAEVGKGRLRVALVRSKGTMGAAYADAVYRALRLEGKTVAESPESFRELSFDADNAEMAAQYAPIADELVSFKPHVVLFSGGRPLVQNAFVSLEARWPKTEPMRPRYASFSLIGSHLLEFVAGDASRRRRVFGAWPVSGSEANARFVARYREVFPEDNVTRTTAPSSTYDAFYLLAFGAYAVPRGEPITGPSLARAFTRLLPPGRSVEVGLTGIFDAYGELEAGRNVDLVGATGGMDFDPATGEADVDQAIMCVGTDASGHPAGVESGLVYSASRHALVGKMSCP